MNNTPILIADRVETIFIDCLYKAGEDTSNHVCILPNGWSNYHES